MTDTGGAAPDGGADSPPRRATAGAVRHLVEPSGPATPAAPDGANAFATHLTLEAGMAAEIARLETKFAGVEATDGELVRVDPHLDSGRPHGRAEFGSSTRVFFANGIQTDAPRALAETAALAARINQPIDLVYVAKGTLAADVERAYAETMFPEAARGFAPEKKLAQEIITSLDAGGDVHVIGFSRGAIVTQLALESVVDHYAREGRSDASIAEHVLSRVSVETLNGASHRMPPGIVAEHYVIDSDSLVTQRLGEGAGAPVILAVAANAIDSSLAALSAVTPEQRVALRGDAGRLLGDVVKVQAGAELAAADPQSSVHALHAIAGDLGRLGSAIAAVRNAPAGTPVRAARDDEARVEPRGDAPPDVAKRRVAEAMPEVGGRGSKLPDVRALEPWDGLAHSGTIFRLDASTYAMHVGQGVYQTLDVRADLHGREPASGAYVDLSRGGNVTPELGQRQHQPQQAQH